VQGGFRPEPSRLDFVVRPKPNVDPEEIRGEAKQVVRVQHNQKVLQSECLVLAYFFSWYVLYKPWEVNPSLLGLQVSKRPQVPISAKKKLFEV
jgi:hypothetical protein